jgi:hypothetical protein
LEEILYVLALGAVFPTFQPLIFHPTKLMLLFKVIRYDRKSHGLTTAEAKYRNELYQLDEESKENEWSFTGLINHHLTIQKVEEASANMDKALETLKNNMASIEQEREARKCVISINETWHWSESGEQLLTIVTIQAHSLHA